MITYPEMDEYQDEEDDTTRSKEAYEHHFGQAVSDILSPWVEAVKGKDRQVTSEELAKIGTITQKIPTLPGETENETQTFTSNDVVYTLKGRLEYPTKQSSTTNNQEDEDDLEEDKEEEEEEKEKKEGRREDESMGKWFCVGLHDHSLHWRSLLGCRLIFSPFSLLSCMIYG